jgi:hypothetical protein
VGEIIGPDPRNFNQRVSLGRNDLLIRTFPIVELRVNHVHADVSLLKDNDIIDADLWRPLIYNFRSYHGITESIGRNFKFDN